MRILSLFQLHACISLQQISNGFWLAGHIQMFLVDCFWLFLAYILLHVFDQIFCRVSLLYISLWLLHTVYYVECFKNIIWQDGIKSRIVPLLRLGCLISVHLLQSFVRILIKLDQGETCWRTTMNSPKYLAIEMYTFNLCLYAGLHHQLQDQHTASYPTTFPWCSSRT